MSEVFEIAQQEAVNPSLIFLIQQSNKTLFLSFRTGVEGVILG